MEERHSQANEEHLIEDPAELAAAESLNALRQFDTAMVLLAKWLADAQKPRIKPSQLLKLNRILLYGIAKSAGTYRAVEMHIKLSKHEPPDASQVPGLVEDLCEYLTVNWEDKSAIYLSSYVLWRVNWIHPFVDGNGRTARIFSYIILCAKLGYVLPGTKTIPEFISDNKVPYYRALESADEFFEKSDINVSKMEEILGDYLAAQLLSAHDEAIGVDCKSVDSEVVVKTLEKIYVKIGKTEYVIDLPDIVKTSLNSKSKNIFENNPVLFGGMFAIIAAIFASIVTYILTY